MADDKNTNSNPEQNRESGEDRQKMIRDAVEKRQHEIAEIYRIARSWEIEPDVADAAVSENKSLADFKADAAEVLHKRSKDNHVTGRDPVDTSVFDRKSLEKYSVLRAIKATSPTLARTVDAGLEREVSQEIERQLDSPAQGIYLLPTAISRDLTTSGSDGGGYTVSTDLLNDELIEMLRNRMAVFRAGARRLTGLRGDVDIPKQSGAATAYWVGEGDSPTESQQTLTQIAGRPHTVGAYTDITRRMLKQSSLDAERFVTDDLYNVIALELDRAALLGSGTDGQPKGVTLADDINTPGVTAGSVTYAELLEFWSDIETDNSMAENMAWIMDSVAFAELAGTSKDTGSGAYLADFEKRSCLGFPVYVSGQLTTKYALFGDFSQLVMGMWGALDVKSDDAALATSGGLRVIVLQDVDVMVRNGKAFAYDDVQT